MGAVALAEDLFELKELCWEDVRDEVQKVNPELAKICDDISPGKEYPLFRIKYPYGSTIVDKGEFCLPSVNERVHPIKDADIPYSIKKQLSYSAIPLSLVLHNNTEVFVEANNRVNALNFFKPGELFGVFETMERLAGISSDPIWSVTAGGRSVFMTPRITDKMGHNRIRKEFGIPTSDLPTDLISQWRVFKGIYERSGGVECWSNDILVFTDKWFDNNNDFSWLNFQKYIFKLCWSQMQLLRDATEFSLLWASFSDAISGRNLKPRPYLVDTLKHLVSIANGAGVAFKPAVDDSALPLSLIQDAYIDCYNLKTYTPTMMQPCKLAGDDKKAYYSLSLPTVLESTAYTRNAPSIIEDERDIKRLLETLQHTIKREHSMINPIKHVEYDFFHTDTDQYGEIYSSKDMVQRDSDFTSFRANHFKNRVSCHTSSFFRGCIRLSVIS